MLEQSDQKFLGVLDSQAEFKKRLKLLVLDRKIRVVYASITTVGAIVMLFIGSRLAQEMDPGVSIYVLLLSVMLLFFPLIFFIQACHTNSQIRTLLVFQKLKALPSE